jgi:hypothetical protein
MTRLLRCIGPLVLAVVVPTAPAQAVRPGQGPKNAVSVSWEETQKHLNGYWQFIRSTFDSVPPQDVPVLKMDGIKVSVMVNPLGSVTSAVCDRNTYLDVVASALAAARALKFKPFERDGHAVWARLDLYFVALPPEQQPSHHVEFPEVRHWNSVRITLHRTRCYGSCPAYQVEIQGDGSVTYEGEKGLAMVEGKRRESISPAAVKELVKAFREADFYSLDDEYAWAATDLPTYETSIEIEGESKTVKDYAGLQVGMPMSVRKLEDLIDQAVNIKQWTEVKRHDK